jgi:hypothetical protein
MRKGFELAIAMLLVASTAVAVQLLVESGDDMLIQGSNYVARVNLKSGTFAFNNLLTIPMYPIAKSRESAAKPLAPSTGKLTVGVKVPSFAVEYPENFAGSVYVSSKVTFSEDYVQHEITVENTHESEEQAADVEILPTDNGTFYIFAPYKRIPDAKYITISPVGELEKGQVMVVSFDNEKPSVEQAQEINQKINFDKVLSWTLKLSAKQKQTLSLKYLAGYVTDEKLLEANPFKPPASKQYLLNTETDPALLVTNIESVSEIVPATPATATGVDILEAYKKVLDESPDTTTSESTLSSIAFDLKAVADKVKTKTPLDSFEKALAFREMTKLKGLPAELHIGEKGGNYYAWAVAYVGATSFTYDPAKKKGTYRELYVEPQPGQCKGDDPYSCPWSGGIRTDLLCIGEFCTSAFIIIGVFVLMFIAVVAVVNYKTDLVYRMLGVKKGAGVLRQDRLEGAYNIIDEKYVPKTPLEQSVWNAMRRRGGVFKVDDYVSETGFSDVLVKSAVETLSEIGIIRKRF